ncbi:MAG: aminodeoxychorismate synthase, component I [Methylophilaceae bacterium 17-44-8]|nr:MAG: aminodeoxychorismate synthase, component I [Methylophilales bacterium 28-44-11]OZA05846.1 MAG: aminodeoxychorismate synthase, component I [Methylophilaceae bacterium 17-44-8]
MALIQHSLPYHHDSAMLFARIKHLRWPMFLDSAQMLNVNTQKPSSQFGRYDILVADPAITFVTTGPHTVIEHANVKTVSEDDPFLLIKQALLNTPSAHSEYPFTGGALGYFSYDLGRRIEKLPTIALNDTQMPEMMVGIYDWAIVVDHREKTAQLVSHQFYTSADTWDMVCALCVEEPPSKQSKFEVETALVSNFDETSYQKAFTKVQRYIHAGDCYQINLAQRFSAQVSGDSWQCYQTLRTVSPAPFMAYMDLSVDEHKTLQVMSVSPERFLQLMGQQVETRPIKGTRPRYDDPQQDLQSAIELVTSLKDRAENVMIVDLLRNDIGKVCERGSVKAEKLFHLQSFANVHHLVSFVTGKLDHQYTAVDLLKSCFPGGSITGAPKLRAMEIIEELEPHRRGIYCGAIGYIGFDGDMDMNITIRTAVVIDKMIYFYAGGGVVADSTSEKEYKETLDKASNFFTAMEMLRKTKS